MRKYPSYTLAELEKFITEGRGNDSMIEEVVRRKEGTSKAFVTPQVEWK